MKSYTKIYKEYRDHVYGYYGYLEEKYSWYKKADNLRDAVKKAFFSEDEQGKVDSHQHRVGRQRLALAAEIALKHFDAQCISSFENFHSVYQFVESVSYKVKGFGQLATYDVALRIAKYLNLELQEVYLHAGVTVGTRALGFNVKDGDIIVVNQFPAPFNQLSGDHLENLLCIYKDVLANSSDEVGKTCIRPKPISPCISKKGCA
jgi:hypothetical protein